MSSIQNDFDPAYLRQHRATISPYRALVSAQQELIRDAWNRLKWDVRSDARQSQKRLSFERNRHQGAKAVILCNGPSLLKTDFGSLKDAFTFGLNKINLLFSKSDFRPSCVVSINRLVLEQNAAFFNETELPLYLSHKAADLIHFRDNVRFLHMVNSHKFARDISGSVNEGATVTFVALQVAFHLGFTRVALVGCDHNFAVQGKANATVLGKGEDKSHFDPNYFAHGVPWQLPDLDASEMAYRLAKGVYEAFDREIVNCTEGGKLEIFRRCPLAEFLQAA
jgi:hypothetical protein